MEDRAIEIKAKHNSKIKIMAIPGHFATSHSHVNHYVDMTRLKTHYKMAREAAKELAKPYLGNMSVDTIVCLEGTEIIGTFLAEELGKENHSSINSGKDIAIITPENNHSGQMIFRDNIQKYIFGKRILLLITSASTGKSIAHSASCLKYYNGQLVAIASLFSAIDSFDDMEVTSIFSTNDITGYSSMTVDKCTLCQSGQKVDAIVNSHGYSKI